MRGATRIGALGCLTLGLVALGCASPIFPAATREPEGWAQIEGSHFSLLADVGSEALRGLAEELEQFTALVRRMAPGLTFPERPLEILIFADPRDFERYRLDESQLGLFVSDGTRSFVVMSEGSFSLLTRQKLFHEFTHYLMSAYAPARGYPLWYSEGFAELMSSADRVDGRARVGLPPARIAGERASGRWIPLAALLTTRHTSELAPADRSLFYAQSWALAHFLLLPPPDQAPRRMRQLRRYLRLLERGASWQRAAERAFGPDLAALEAELHAYWLETEQSVRGLAFDPDSLAPAAIGEPHEISQPEVDSILEELAEVMRRIQDGAPPAPVAGDGEPQPR